MQNANTGRRRIALILLIFLFVLLVLLFGARKFKEKMTDNTVLMGGKFFMTEKEDNGEKLIKTQELEAEKETNKELYFRPSNLPVLNTRFGWDFFKDYLDKNPSEIELPSALFQTPEDTILNYYSILREAANVVKGKSAGCGTLGDAGVPYPIAYNFLTKAYKERLSYKQYRKSFENILHINLIKYHSVPLYDNKDNSKRYFIELETIEGTERNQGSFAYYYGFVDLEEEKGEFKISNQEFYGENYLCAPYHGWAYDAEMSVQVKYGDWCDLIDKMYPVKQEGYIKNISFLGKDGLDYLMVFYQLTNGTDIEIAQYRKGSADEWKQIELNPEECINKRE